MDNDTEIPNKVSEESTEANWDTEETSSIESSPLSQISDSEDTVDLTKEEKDYVNLFDHKKQELEIIQNDLSELMVRLNSFITDSQDEADDLGEEDPSCEAPVLEQDDSIEKQDGLQEKELLQENNWNNISIENMYMCDDLNPPEINWDVWAPFIKNVVGDMQKIRKMNQITTSVMQRLRSITEHKDTISD